MEVCLVDVIMYVCSSNGVSRCGVFIGANVCIDQMDMDHEVDVFHAVKLIRINRPQLIDLKVQFSLTEIVKCHTNSSPILRNFQLLSTAVTIFPQRNNLHIVDYRNTNFYRHGTVICRTR